MPLLYSAEIDFEVSKVAGLAEFDFEFEHKKGSSKRAADALSRKSEDAALCILAHLQTSKIDGSMRDVLREFLQKDPAAQTVMNLAKAGKTRQFWVEDDLLVTSHSYEIRDRGPPAFKRFFVARSLAGVRRQRIERRTIMLVKSEKGREFGFEAHSRESKRQGKLHERDRESSDYANGGNERGLAWLPTPRSGTDLERSLLALIQGQGKISEESQGIKVKSGSAIDVTGSNTRS
ncbi:reverse transcriptase [Cucumis melo var. makuwa]|uniref:Reverse transcriptase n=1 Tax=Cucumis melo var. makuwa TaxID=1194695 RepID=A0A5A7UCG9_CUCMM|nr:reverse transcriptase [Cucumis melo var. makuwa]